MRSNINNKNHGEEGAFLEMAGLVGSQGASGGQYNVKSLYIGILLKR